MIDLNPISFINTYVKYNSFDKGLSNFKLYPFQEEMVNNFYNNKLNICVSSRQSGKSSVPLYYLLYKGIFNNYSNIAILNHKKATAFDLLERLKFAYNNISDIYGLTPPKILVSNKSSFELDNGSRFIASNANVCSIRGQTFTDIFLDEFACVPYKEAKDLVKCYYPIILSTKITNVIITSTKNKGSYFDILYRYGKKESNSVVVSKYNWDAVPRRDQMWKNNIISIIGENAFKQEYFV